MAQISLKETLAKVLPWIKTPLISNDAVGVDTMYEAKRTDTNVQVGFGIGTGGTIHGIYSRKLNTWMIHGDASNVYVDGIRMGTYSGQATKSGNYYSSGQIVYYYKNGVVTVHCSGIALGTITARTTIATIPAGVRPPNEEYGKVDGQTSVFYVNPAGNVQVTAGLSGKTIYGTLTYVAWN